MTNTNCLENVCCPKCGQEDRFKIAAVISCLVTDDGSEPVGDHEWYDDSATHCLECGFDGKLKDFRTMPKLPPGPDGKNDDRAAWAGSALTAFMQVTGTDLEDALGDLLADLMHWSDRNNYQFDAALDRARSHYDAETVGEAPPDLRNGRGLRTKLRSSPYEHLPVPFPHSVVSSGPVQFRALRGLTLLLLSPFWAPRPPADRVPPGSAALGRITDGYRPLGSAGANTAANLPHRHEYPPGVNGADFSRNALRSVGLGRGRAAR